MPWGDTALITESVKRKEKVVKAQKTIFEEYNFSTDQKEVFAKKPEQKLTWAKKAVELASKHHVKVNLVFDIFSNPRFILSFGQGRGAQFRALVEQNLDLFSAKQQKFLQSKECKLTTFEGGEDSDDGADADPKAIVGGRTVEVIDPFEVFNQGEDKIMLKKGTFGVISRTDKDGDALIDFFRDGQSGPTFAMWVFGKDFPKLDIKAKITSTSEIKINFKTTIFSKSGGEPPAVQFKTRKAPAVDKDESTKDARDDDRLAAEDAKAARDDDSGSDTPPPEAKEEVVVKRKEKLSGLFQPDAKLQQLLDMGKQSVAQAKVDLATVSSQPHAPIKLSFKASTPKPLLGLKGKDTRLAAESGRPDSDPASIALAAAERAASVANIQLPVQIPAPASPPRDAAPRRRDRSERALRKGSSRSRSRSAGRALLRRIIRHDSRSRSRRPNGSGNRGRARGESRSVDRGRGSQRKPKENVQYVWLQAGVDYVKDRGRFDKHGRPEIGSRLRSTPPPAVISWMLDQGHCREDEDFRERKAGSMLLS